MRLVNMEPEVSSSAWQKYFKMVTGYKTYGLLLILVILSFTSFKKKAVTWVAIGDSITYLNDHLDETGNRVTKGYMTRVKEAIPEIDFVNQGYNGWTASRIAKEIDGLGIPRADIYSVFLGTNDWWSAVPLGSMRDYDHNTGHGSVYGSFRIILDKIKSLHPAARIVLITPMQRTDFVYLGDKRNNAWGSYKDKNGQSLESIATAIREIGKKERISTIDLFHKKGMGLRDLVTFKRLRAPGTGVYTNYAYPEYLSVPFHPADEYPYPESAIKVTYDGLHPSDSGYQMIADALIATLKR